MGKCAIIRFAACAVAFMAISAFGTELTHRWSFNGDWSDSVGGADAVKCGSYVSLYGNRVHMGYGGCSWGTGYVDLGTNMLDTTAATIEIWARHDGVESWSRIFDYGRGTSHFFCLSWSRDENINQDQVGARSSGGSWEKNDSMAPYEIGTDYYIAVTLEKQGDATLARWQRRDAATGELQKSGTLTMGSGVHTFDDPVLYLGHSQHSSNKDALAAYDEVRVWRGVLTDEQLAASAAAGPDATIAVEEGALQFTAAVAPEPPAQRAAVQNGGFRMMTYNIQYCYDELNTIIPDRTAARIIAENPDFCCVNEVRDSTAHPEATMLAKLTGMYKTFGGNDKGSNGNLILSKEEPLGQESVFLKMAPSPVGWGDRYCVIAEFKDFCVAAVHLDTTNQGPSADVQASNAVAIATIRGVFAKYAKPVFLCGDWNTRPDWDNMARFNEFLEILSPTNGVRTYHGHGATGGHIIDYISVDRGHKDDFFVQSSYVVEDIVTSDHNPVLAELYRRPAASALGWIDESFLTTGRTGTWSPSVAWNGGTWTAELGGTYSFEANKPSGGDVVTMTVTASFDAVPVEEAMPDETAQGAVWLGTNGCFQVWTKAGNGEPGTYPPSEASAEGGSMRGGNGWIDVAAEGVTPQTGVEYTFRFVFDYRYGTYSVSVFHNGTYIPLVQSVNRTHFPLAVQASCVSRVKFIGDGAFTSLLGEWAEKAKGMCILLR